MGQSFGFCRSPTGTPPPCGGRCTDALEDLLLRLGRLAEDLPEVSELALDPVLAGPSGCIAVDVRLRLSAVGCEPDPYLRDLLRRPSIDGNWEPKP